MKEKYYTINCEMNLTESIFVDMMLRAKEDGLLLSEKMKHAETRLL